MELQKLIDGLRAHRNGAASYESVDEAISVLEAMLGVNAWKVCKGLECCVLRDPDDHRRCGECPYNSHAISNEPCANGLKFNALDLIRQQQARIAELEAGKTWISVKDRLPDEQGDYLVVRRLPIRAVTLAWYAGENGWLALDGGFYTDEAITHFMSLPEPPKEE